MKLLNIGNLNPAEPEQIADFCAARRSERRGAFLIAVNPIKVIKARRRPDFQRLIDRADLVFADGRGIVWAVAVLEGRRIPLAPGHRVMEAILRRAAADGASVYFLGTTEASLRLALDRIRCGFPGLRIAGAHHGFFPQEAAAAVEEGIRAAAPDYVLVAMGEGRQERMIDRLRLVLPGAVYLGVGGSLDLIAGLQPRPPEWVYARRWEWLYRLFRQPFRAPRFRALPIFASLVILEKAKRTVAGRRNGRPGGES